MSSYLSTHGSGANSLQGFKAFASRRPPSYNNLYWVRFRSIPNTLRIKADSFFSPFFDGGSDNSTGLSYGSSGRDESRLINYYANDVTIPSRQITTGDAKTVGALYRYPTGTTFSEISINFTLSRDLTTRTFFERWMNYITEDSGNRVSWYEDITCPFMDIFKYERGGVNPSNAAISVVNPTTPQGVRDFVQFNKISGVWSLSNIFPFNISNIQLTNGQAGTLNMEVSFYYERYRFFIPKNSGTSNIPAEIGSSTSTTIEQLLQTPAATADGSSTATTTAKIDSSGKIK
jgi:hypothetical protein